MYYTPKTGFVNATGFCFYPAVTCLAELVYGLSLVNNNSLFYWADNGINGTHIWKWDLTPYGGSQFCVTAICNAGIVPQVLGNKVCLLVEGMKKNQN